MKVYLGDGVYAEEEHDMIKLTTEIGLPELTNIVYLEKEVFVSLVTFASSVWGMKSEVAR